MLMLMLMMMLMLMLMQRIDHSLYQTSFTKYFEEVWYAQAILLSVELIMYIILWMVRYGYNDIYKY